MKNIDVKNNIKDDDALKHKNFKDVLTKYGNYTIPFYKKPAFIGTSLLAASIITLLVFNLNNPIVDDKESIIIMENASYTAKYDSPIENSINYEVIDVEIINEPIEVVTKSGSKINIPINSLVDVNGKPIKGKIELKYREFFDQKDIFLSGIPMNYNEDGEKKVFESGGMFELLAYQRNNPIYIGSNKKIDVLLASKEVGNNFNIYYYSPNEKKWIYEVKDSSGFNSKKISKVDSVLSYSEMVVELNKLEVEKLRVRKKSSTIQKPIRPKVQDEKKESFTIDVDYNEFPELSSFKGLRFQISDKEKNYNPKYANVEWSEVNVFQGEKVNEYNVCFSKPKKNPLCFLTNPVVDKSNEAISSLRYNEMLSVYKEKKKELKRKQKELRKAIAEQEKLMKQKRIEELNRILLAEKVNLQSRITRAFTIGKFGIWNSDAPQNLPTEAIVEASFVNEDGEEIYIDVLYMVLKDKNAVIRLNKSDWENGLYYKPGQEFLLWAVTNDNQYVGIVGSDQFQGLRKAKSYTFTMNLISNSEFVKLSVEEILNL